MENGKNLIHSFNHSETCEGNFQGLTKREYFTGLALQGILSKYEGKGEFGFDLEISKKYTKEVSFLAVMIADEVLKSLEKNK